MEPVPVETIARSGTSRAARLAWSALIAIAAVAAAWGLARWRERLARESARAAAVASAIDLRGRWSATAWSSEATRDEAGMRVALAAATSRLEALHSDDGVEAVRLRARVSHARRELGDARGAREFGEHDRDVMRRAEAADPVAAAEAWSEFAWARLESGDVGAAAAAYANVLSALDRVPELRSELAVDLRCEALVQAARLSEDERVRMGLVREALAVDAASAARVEPPSAAPSSPDGARGPTTRARAIEDIRFVDEDAGLDVRERARRRAARRVALLDELAASLARLGEPQDSLVTRREAAGLARTALDDDDPRRALAVYRLASDLHDFGRSAWAESELAYREALATWRAASCGDDPAVVTAQSNASLLLHWLGRPREALPLLEEALASARRLDASDSRGTATMWNNLGTLKASLGDHAEAERVGREALAMRRRLFSGDHLDVAQSSNNVADALLVAGRPSEALPFAREAAEMYARLEPEGSRSSATAFDNFGDALDGTGDGLGAITAYRRALAIEDRLLDRDDDLRLGTVDSLADTLDDAEQWVESARWYREALAIRRRRDTVDPSDLSVNLGNYARVLRRMGDAKAALPLYVEAVGLRRRIAPEGDRGLASALDGLSLVQSRLDRMEEAEASAREALAVRRRVLPTDHFEVARSLNNLSGILQERLRFEEALPLLVESIEMHKRLSTEETRELLIGVDNLGTLYTDLGDFDRAEAAHREALGMSERVLRGDDSDTAWILYNLGKLLRRRGRLDEAESLLARALAMRQRLYAFDSPETADACAELGRVIAARGDPSTAIERQRESLRIRRAIHAGDHDEVQSSLTDLGLALRGAGRGAEARPVLEEAFLMRRRLSPEDDPEVTEARLNLAFLLSEDLGDPASAEVLLRAALASETRRRAVGDPELAEYHRHVGDACRAQEHVADAEREYVAALELRRAQSPRGSAACAQSLCDVAWARARRGDVAKAEAWSREAFTMACAHLPEAEGAVLESARRLVTILRSRDELADAEAIVLAAYGALARANGGSDDARRAAARDARDFYEALDAARPRQGFAEKAAAWRELATRPLEAGPTPTPR